MRFKGSESRKKKNVVAIATLAFLSTTYLNVYPTTHSKYIDEGTLAYSATVHPLYKGDVHLTLLGNGANDEKPSLEANQSTYKDAFFKFTFDQNDALTGSVTDTYEMQIEPSGACEILSAKTEGTLDKSKNTITYTSAGKDQNEVIMHCSVSALSKDTKNIKVSVTIKETIVKGEITKVIETYKDGSFVRTLDEYYKDYPLESKLKWSPTYIELPDTLPEGFFEQLKLGTLPNYLQQYLKNFDYDATFGSIDLTTLSEKEQLYLLFKEVWLKEIVSKTYGDALSAYVTKAYKNGNDLFDSAVINTNNANLKGLSGKTKEEHVIRYDVLENLIGYARVDAEDGLAAKENRMYFSTSNAKEMNQAFAYYLEKYTYLNGKVKPGTDEYQLLMDYINYFAPNKNGIADIVLNNIKVEGLTFNKEDGRLDIDPNILTMANGLLYKIIEIPFASPDVKADLADGLTKYYNDILSSEAIEWIRTKVTEMSNSVLNQTDHDDYIAWYYPTGDKNYFLFHITGDIDDKKAFVQVKAFDYQPSYDVDANRYTLRIEEEETLKVIQALDTYFKVPLHTSVEENHFYVDVTVNDKKVKYKIPDRKVSLPFDNVTLDTLVSELPKIVTQDVIDSLRSVATERKEEMNHFLSNVFGTKRLVVQGDDGNYILFSSFSNGSDSVYVTAKKLFNYLSDNDTTRKFILEDENQGRLLEAVQALDNALGVGSYGHIVHSDLTNDAFITTTESNGITKVVYKVATNQIIIPFDAPNMKDILGDGLEKYYKNIMSSDSILYLRTYGAEVGDFIAKHTGDAYILWDYYSDDGNNNNDFTLFFIHSDEKSQNTYVTAREVKRAGDGNYVDGTRRVLTIRVTDNDDALKIVQAIDTNLGLPLHEALYDRYHIANATVKDGVLTYEVPQQNVKITAGSSLATFVSELQKTYSFINSDIIDSLYDAATLRKEEVDYFLSGTAGVKRLVLRDGANNFVLLSSFSNGSGTYYVTAKKLDFYNSSRLQLIDKSDSKLLQVVQAIDNAIGAASFGHPIHTAVNVLDNYIVSYATQGELKRVLYNFNGTSTASFNAEEIMVSDVVKQEEILEVKEIEKGQNQILDTSLENSFKTDFEDATLNSGDTLKEDKNNVSEVDVDDTLKEKVDDNILASDDDSSLPIDNQSSVEEEKILEAVEDVSTTPSDASSVDSGSSLENTDNITPAVTEDVTNLTITDSLNANLN